MKKWIEKLLEGGSDKIQKATVNQVIKQKEDFLAFDGELELIIVSDNHGAKDGLFSVLKQHPNADYYFHCGDSNLDSSLELMKSFVTVKGNTDYSENYKNNERVGLTSGEHVWITHGHAYAVNNGTTRLIAEATEIPAKTPITHIVLYGHTHIVDVEMKQGVLVINPGSITQPRGGSFIRSYARLVITPKFYTVQIKNALDHTIVREFQFPREWHQSDQDPK